MNLDIYDFIPFFFCTFSCVLFLFLTSFPPSPIYPSVCFSPPLCRWPLRYFSEDCCALTLLSLSFSFAPSRTLDRRGCWAAGGKEWERRYSLAHVTAYPESNQWHEDLFSQMLQQWSSGNVMDASDLSHVLLVLLVRI